MRPSAFLVLAFVGLLAAPLALAETVREESRAYGPSFLIPRDPSCPQEYEDACFAVRSGETWVSVRTEDAHGLPLRTHIGFAGCDNCAGYSASCPGDWWRIPPGATLVTIYVSYFEFENCGGLTPGRTMGDIIATFR